MGPEKLQRKVFTLKDILVKKACRHQVIAASRLIATEKYMNEFTIPPTSA